MANRKKPTGLKVLEGTNRRDRANEAEPAYDLAGDPGPPDTLRDGRAVQIWHELYGVLTSKHVLTVADRLALVELCNQQSEVDQIRRSGGQPGPGDKTQLRLMYVEFGLTPSSRPKVSSVGERVDASDPWSELTG